MGRTLYVNTHNFWNGLQCSTNSTEHPQVVSAVSEGFCSGCLLPLAPCCNCSEWLRCDGCGAHFQLDYWPEEVE